MFGISGLLGPYSVEAFLKDSLGQKSLYVKGTEDKFEGLFSWDDINHLLNTARPKNSIKLVYETSTLPQAQLSNLSYWLNKGATLVIDWLQLLDEFVYHFCQELARDFNSEVNINSYISCPSKQGFDVHFDKHDVFIVQVEGQKRWRIFEPTLIKTPIQAMEVNQDDCLRPDPDKESPYCDCVLSEGDVLYIPRGHWHYAVAVSPSVHLTVGIDPTSGIELLNWITKDLMDKDEFFRRDMPIAQAAEFGGPGGLQSIDDYIAEFRSHIRKVMDRDDMLELIVQNCMLKNQLRRESKLPFIWDLENSLTPETRFSLLGSQKALIHYDPSEKCTVIYLRGSVLKLNEFPETLIRTLFASTGVFTGTSIVESSPEFTWQQVKELLVKMYQNGVIINVDENEV